MIKEHFFPTIIYAQDIQLDNKTLSNDIIVWSQKEKGLKKTNVKGWHSDTNMHQLPQFKSLVDQLFLVIQDVWKEEQLDKQPVLGNMWANINYPGSYNRPHVHPNSLFSGVYFVQANEASGKLVCNDPRPGVQTNKPLRKNKLPQQLWNECHLAPIPGRVIMFPAWLWHCVEPNESNDLRISVSFNFLQKGFE
tara:strand:+ start:216 stop:794 length:579 start_codon:yes stop_codon:yes gene_type:complete